VKTEWIFGARGFVGTTEGEQKASTWQTSFGWRTRPNWMLCRRGFQNIRVGINVNDCGCSPIYWCVADIWARDVVVRESSGMSVR
jgi:hypothetical protein